MEETAGACRSRDSIVKRKEISRRFQGDFKETSRRFQGDFKKNIKMMDISYKMFFV